MPELPEVETVRRGLMPVMEGGVIAHAHVRRPDLRWPFPDGMAERLTGSRVLGLRRRSKFILADLSTGETLLIHLGMSGRMVVSMPAASPPIAEGPGGHHADPGPARELPGQFHRGHRAAQKHDHVIFDMGSGARITFNDARRFGAMDLVPTDGVEAHKLLRNLGPEPLGNSFNDAYLIARLRGRKTLIKAALLDQGVVAGMGNIYVCEALFRAGISPLREAGRVSPVRVARLVSVIRDVLAEAIEAGGSSLRDYRQATGELGYFQHGFRVYGREGLPCVNPTCAGVVRRTVQSGRSSFHCPRCQR